jgi:hypothetical protein
MTAKSIRLVVFIAALNVAVGFVVVPSMSRLVTQRGCCVDLSARLLEQDGDLSTLSPLSLPRRQVLQAALSAVFLGASALPALAADETKGAVYLTGKAPKIPGQKPKDKNDTAGTRRDPKFLRSLSDCKSRCETTATSEGLARSKEDCLSECQDICCTSYEQ